MTTATIRDKTSDDMSDKGWLSQTLQSAEQTEQTDRHRSTLILRSEN